MKSRTVDTPQELEAVGMFENEIKLVPLHGLCLELDESHHTCVLRCPESGEVYHGTLAIHGRPTDWALALTCTALGKPFRANMSYAEVVCHLAQFREVVLDQTVVAYKYFLGVTTTGEIYSLLSSTATRPDKIWLHGHVGRLLSEKFGEGSRIRPAVLPQSYGRVTLRYFVDGMPILDVVYGNDTGCSAYEVRFNAVSGAMTEARQWRHCETHGALLTLLRLAVLLSVRRSIFNISTN